MSKKRPKRGAFVSPGKKPRVETCNLPSADSEHPVWQIGLIDMDGPFGWRRMGASQLRDAWKRLKAFESMTWHEIKGSDNHYIPIHNLSRCARDRLGEINQDDIDALFSLRISGKQRIFGILDENCLKMLWWDPNHDVCPTRLKGT